MAESCQYCQNSKCVMNHNRLTRVCSLRLFVFEQSFFKCFSNFKSAPLFLNPDPAEVTAILSSRFEFNYDANF